MAKKEKEQKEEQEKLDEETESEEDEEWLKFSCLLFIFLGALSSW